MLLENSGDWLILTENFLLLNQNCGRRWAGKVQILQQISGPSNSSMIKLNGESFHCTKLEVFFYMTLFSFLRAGGFMSLENLIYLAKNYPVTYLYIFHLLHKLRGTIYLTLHFSLRILFGGYYTSKMEGELSGNTHLL